MDKSNEIPKHFQYEVSNTQSSENSIFDNIEAIFKTSIVAVSTLFTPKRETNIVETNDNTKTDKTDDFVGDNDIEDKFENLLLDPPIMTIGYDYDELAEIEIRKKYAIKTYSNKFISEQDVNKCASEIFGAAPFITVGMYIDALDFIKSNN